LVRTPELDVDCSRAAGWSGAALSAVTSIRVRCIIDAEQQ
jgi:hypothetical protein